jgi:coenzyme F420-reducing hydrogenase alpha subunit
MSESVLSHYVCKIEGHGSLKLNYKTGKAKLEIDEGERLFERLVLGHPFLDAPFITARICGICPTAHTLASILAIENAFDVKVTPNISLFERHFWPVRLFSLTPSTSSSWQHRTIWVWLTR